MTVDLRLLADFRDGQVGAIRPVSFRDTTNPADADESTSCRSSTYGARRGRGYGGVSQRITRTLGYAVRMVRTRHAGRLGRWIVKTMMIAAFATLVAATAPASASEVIVTDPNALPPGVVTGSNAFPIIVTNTTGNGSTSVSRGSLDEPVDQLGATITIRDQGPGIDPARRDTLFRKFHHRGGNGGNADAMSGTGMGLFIVATLAERVVAAVRCDASESAGATFVVTLPINDRPAPIFHTGVLITE